MRSLIELSYLLFSGCRAFAELLAYLHCTLSLLCLYTSSAFVPAVASVYASACVIGLTYSARFFFFSLLAFHTEPHFSIGHHAQLLSLAFLQNLSWSLRNFIELHPRSRFLKSLSCFFFFFTVFGLLINRHFVLILVPNLAAREEEPKELEESKATPNHSSTSTLPQHVHKTREVFFFRILYRSSIYLT